METSIYVYLNNCKIEGFFIPFIGYKNASNHRQTTSYHAILKKQSIQFITSKNQINR